MLAVSAGSCVCSAHRPPVADPIKQPSAPCEGGWGAFSSYSGGMGLDRSSPLQGLVFRPARETLTEIEPSPEATGLPVRLTLTEQ